MRSTPLSALCFAVLATGFLSACSPAQRATQVKRVIDNGNSTGCGEERSTMQRAVDAFMLLNPDLPVTEAALVDAGILHEDSKLMDVAVDGTVLPAADTVCR